MIRCKCPNGDRLNVKSSYAGKKIKCPKCGAVFVLPAQSDADEPKGDHSAADHERKSQATGRSSKEASRANPERRRPPTGGRRTRRPAVDASHEADQQTARTAPDAAVDKSTPKPPAGRAARRYQWMSQVKGWKAVVAAIVIVSLIGWRVVDRMNGWNEQAGPNPGGSAATTGTVVPIERGDDFVIDGVVQLPAPVGYTWKLRDERTLADGTASATYEATSDDPSTVINFTIINLTVQGDDQRQAVLTQHRSDVSQALKDKGASNVRGPELSLTPPIPNHVSLSLNGTASDNQPVELVGGIIFGNNTYHYEVLSAAPGRAEQLASYMADITELGLAREIPLAGRVLDTAIGEAGRVMVLHLANSNEAVVVDLSSRQVVATIPVPQNGLIAANQEVVAIVAPDGTTELWSLATFQQETNGQLDIDGAPFAIAMGHSSSGSMLMHWVTADTGREYHGIVDLDSFTVRAITSYGEQIEQGVVRISSNARAQSQVRAAGNGRVFLLRPGTGSSSMERLFAGKIPYVKSESTDSGGHVLPSPDGRFHYTGQGHFSGTMIRHGDADRTPCFATCDSRFFLTFRRDEFLVRDALTGETVSALPPLTELGSEFIQECKFGYVKEPPALMPDQRIHCVPDMNLLVTIPLGEDRLQFRDVPFDTFANPTTGINNGVLELPGIVYRAISAGNGRLLIAQMPELGGAAVVDLTKKQIIGSIPVPDGGLITGGRDKVVVIDTLGRQMTRWSLSTLKPEARQTVDLNGTPLAVAMGSASSGPAMVYWSHQNGKEFSLLDVDRLQFSQLSQMRSSTEPIGVLPIYVRGESWARLNNVGLNVRASADGQTFGVTKLSNSDFELITLAETPECIHDSAAGYGIPTPDGNVLTARGILSADLMTRSRTDQMYFPTSDSRYVISLAHEDGAAELQDALTGNTVSLLPELTEFDQDFISKAGSGKPHPYQLTIDQRLFCVPGASVLATIPPTDDRIIFRDLMAPESN